MADGTLKLLVRKGFRCCPFVELPLDVITQIAEEAAEAQGFGVVETIEFLPSSSRLVDVETDELPNGAIMKVLSVEDLWQLVKAPTAELMNLANTTPMVAIESVANPGEVWIRLELGSNRWRTQTAWVIDPINGNEENTGAPGSPIQTFREFSRRMGPTGEIPATIDVTLTSNSMAEDTLYLKGLSIRPDAIFRFLGTPTILDSGTFTAVTNLNSATQTPPDVTDAAQDFTAYVNKRIRITTPGPRLNAIAWIAKLLGPTQVRTSAWGVNNTLSVPFGESVTLVNPQIGDAYVIEDLPILSSVSLALSKVQRGLQSFDGCVFADLTLGRTAVLNDRLYFGNDANIALSGCVIAARNIYGRSVSATNCLQLPAVFHLGTLTWYAGMQSGTARPLNPCQIQIAQQCLCQGGLGFFADAGSFMFISDAMSFDNGAGVIVSTDSELHLAGLLWGTGNTNQGMLVAGRAHYDVAFKPTVTGGASDTRIGGVNLAYAAIPVGPNALNGAMLCVTPV